MTFNLNATMIVRSSSAGEVVRVAVTASGGDHDSDDASSFTGTGSLLPRALARRVCTGIAFNLKFKLPKM